MNTTNVTIYFYCVEWGAQEIVDLLAGCEIVSHHAQNAAKYRDFTAEDLQEELENDHGWPHEIGTIDQIGDDGASTLTVMANVPAERWEAVQAALDAAEAPDQMTLSYEVNEKEAGEENDHA